MFHTLEQEVVVIEKLLEGIDDTVSLTPQGLVNTADTFVALKELEQRLSYVRKQLGAAIVANRGGNDVIRMPQHTISFVSGHKTLTNWKSIAIELESWIDKDKYDEVVMHNTRMVNAVPTLRVSKNK